MPQREKGAGRCLTSVCIIEGQTARPGRRPVAAAIWRVGSIGFSWELWWAASLQHRTCCCRLPSSTRGGDRCPPPLFERPFIVGLTNGIIRGHWSTQRALLGALGGVLKGCRGKSPESPRGPVQLLMRGGGRPIITPTERHACRQHTRVLLFFVSPLALPSFYLTQIKSFMWIPVLWNICLF